MEDLMRTHSLLMLGGLAITGCGDKDGGETGGGDSGAPVAELSYGEVQTVLGQSCGFSSCHGAGAGDLMLGDGNEHANLVGIASVDAPDFVLVEPGDADASYLIKKMEGTSDIAGTVMPPSGALDQATIDGIRDWIDRGAPQE
jgi:hypothetical protein